MPVVAQVAQKISSPSRTPPRSPPPSPLPKEKTSSLPATPSQATAREQCEESVLPVEVYSRKVSEASHEAHDAPLSEAAGASPKLATSDAGEAVVSSTMEVRVHRNDANRIRDLHPRNLSLS